MEHLSPLASLALALSLSILLPKAMERLRLPGVLGYILAGVILGPAVTGYIEHDGKVMQFLAEIGKLLFMFFVGFEIDIEEFNKSRRRSMIFGALTFGLPFAAGVTLATATGYSPNGAALIGSLIASHTLLAFPILQKLGLTRHPAVLMVIGGTIFTDIASMMVLAVTVSVHQTGFSWAFLLKEIVQLAIYVPLVIFGAGSLARKAIIRYGDRPELRMMILLVMIAACAEGAALIQLEGIVGAFLAGIAAKRTLRGKFAVEQLEVTAHAIFIPAFFLATGFLIDFGLMGKTLMERPLIVAGLLIALFFGKYLASWLTARIFPDLQRDVSLVASLSLPQMAATLASAVVAYETLNPGGERLLDGGYVNGILLLVVVTCVLGPILTSRAARATRQVDDPPDHELSGELNQSSS